MKTYSEKLRDPRWQRKRLEVLQRDDFTCRRCQSKTDTLHVHHVRYLRGRDPWDYRDYYLVTLCEDCHKAEESEIKGAGQPRPETNPCDIERFLKQLRDSGDIDSADKRAIATTKCIEMLAGIRCRMEMDHQINLAATYLRCQAGSLRYAVAKQIGKIDGRQVAGTVSREAQPTILRPTPVHRTIEFLCHLMFCSTSAQRVICDHFDKIREAGRWVEGSGFLLRIMKHPPNAESRSDVKAFIDSLPPADRLAVVQKSLAEGAPDDGGDAAIHAIKLLDVTVLQRRDAAVKAALREPGIGNERLLDLLQEAKSISAELRQIGEIPNAGIPASNWNQTPNTPK